MLPNYIIEAGKIESMNELDWKTPVSTNSSQRHGRLLGKAQFKEHLFRGNWTGNSSGVQCLSILFPESAEACDPS